MSTGKDAELYAKVESALSENPESSLYDIKLAVVEGEVRLTGIVDTLADRERLYRTVAQVPGVKHIASEISLSTDGDITDRGVEFEVAEELSADPQIDVRHIGAKSDKGMVTLVGRTDNPAELEAARKAASRARGVTKVVSQVKTRQESPSLEELFHTQVRNDNEEQ